VVDEIAVAVDVVELGVGHAVGSTVFVDAGLVDPHFVQAGGLFTGVVVRDPRSSVVYVSASGRSASALRGAAVWVVVIVDTHLAAAIVRGLVQNVVIEVSDDDPEGVCVHKLVEQFTDGGVGDTGTRLRFVDQRDTAPSRRVFVAGDVVVRCLRLAAIVGGQAEDSGHEQNKSR
jgi:hypothetical protein